MQSGPATPYMSKQVPRQADADDPRSKHSHHSSFREKLIEHLLIGELLKCSWKNGDCALEISRPEVDRTGYDLLAEHRGCLRHIQLKGSRRASATVTQKVHVALADKPSGCVVWVYLDDDSLQLGPFLFFGGEPGQRLPALTSFTVARHTKGNAEGYKAERPNFRVVPKAKFKRLDTIDDLWLELFGDAGRGCVPHAAPHAGGIASQRPARQRRTSVQ